MLGWKTIRSPLKPLIPKWVKRQKFKVSIGAGWNGKAVLVMELGGKEAVWIGSFEVTSEGSSSSLELVLPEIGSHFPWDPDIIHGLYSSVGCSSIAERLWQGTTYSHQLGARLGCSSSCRHLSEPYRAAFKMPRWHTALLIWAIYMFTNTKLKSFGLSENSYRTGSQWPLFIKAWNVIRFVKKTLS